jgi:hypothetical protein
MTELKRPERGPMPTQPNRGPEPRPMSMKPSKRVKKPARSVSAPSKQQFEATRLQSLKKQRTFRNDTEGSG